MLYNLQFYFYIIIQADIVTWCDKCLA